MLSPRTSAQHDEPINFSAHQKCLRDSFRPRLHRILEIQTEARSVAQQLFESGRVLRRGDDEDVAYTRQHQRGKRVINHGLVVDGQQALADRMSHRIQTRARSAGQNDALVFGLPETRLDMKKEIFNRDRSSVYSYPFTKSAYESITMRCN